MKNIICVLLLTGLSSVLSLGSSDIDLDEPDFDIMEDAVPNWKVNQAALDDMK